MTKSTHEERLKLYHYCDLHEERFSYKNGCNKCYVAVRCNIKKSECQILSLEHPCETCIVRSTCKLYITLNSSEEICQNLSNYIRKKSTIKHYTYIKILKTERNKPFKDIFMRVVKFLTSK